MFKLSSKVAFIVCAIGTTFVLSPSQAEAGIKEDGMAFVRKLIKDGARKSHDANYLCSMTRSRLSPAVSERCSLFSNP